MKLSITQLPVKQKFFYKNEEFEVTSRDEFPFIEAKCVSEPNNYNGYNLLFTNFEIVEIENPF